MHKTSLSRSLKSPSLTSRSVKSRGLTLIEVAFAAAAVGVATIACVPLLSSMDDKAKVMGSIANLKNLAVANANYASDWGDRQFTVTPDDAGMVGGDGAQYLEKIGCPPQVVLGWGSAAPGGEVGMWGYFLDGGKCAGTYPNGSISNWSVYLPLSISGKDAYGSFRLPNVKGFHDYVNGRFYDPSFYAPKDEAVLAKAQPNFESPQEYPGGQPVESSYCFSPAALFDAKVFAGAEGDGAPRKDWAERLRAGDAFRSPAISRCRYPSLKTQMIEHNWLQNRPDSMSNPRMGDAPWTFNQGIASAPTALFFDGHIESIACERAMRDDEKAGGLWLRETPLGESGYYGAQAFDGFVRTSFHILTKGGIEGRDILGPDPVPQPARESVGAPGASVSKGATAFIPAPKPKQ